MQIYRHPPTSPTLHAALKLHLPHSTPLLYRTQHPSQTPTTHTLATFPASLPPSETPRCWAALYLDRSVRPETELWIYAAGVRPGHGKGSGETQEDEKDKEGFCPTCTAAISALLHHISTLPVPPIRPDNAHALDIARQHEREHPETGPGVKYAATSGAYMRHLLLPGVVTLGACDARIVQLCEDAGLVRHEFPGMEARLNKFFFRVADLPETKELPAELRWGEVREQDVAKVQARTAIPRATRTLMSLKSVGVFERGTGEIVAWTFQGLDGSLTTLHTEAEWRGRGIAKAVAAKVIREHAPGLAVDAEVNAWAHADVYEGNVQSESVCRSLGGKPGMKIYWVRIDLSRASALAK